LRINNADSSKSYITGFNGAQVYLYHNGSPKLETTSTGIDVTGNLSATKLIALNGTLELDDNGTHNGIINVPASLFINIDSDGTNTGEDFVIAKDRSSTSGGTELFRVQEDGNVGIGTASPNEKLNVSGNVRVTSGFVSFSGSISTPSEAAAVYRPVDNTLAFSTANTERMRIDNSGVVTINYSAGSSDNTILRIKGGTAGYSSLQLGDADDINVGMIQYNHSANSLAFNVNDADRMRILNNGRVGIGTASPEVLTHLKSSDNTIFEIESTTATAYMKMVDSNTTGAGYIGYVTNDMTFWANNAERMRIDSIGRVGIGTTSPLRNLQIGNHSGAQQALSIQASTTGKSDIFLGDGTGSGEYAGLVRYDHASDFMSFWTASSESVRIDSSGQTMLSGSTAAFDNTGAVNGLQLHYTTTSGKGVIGTYSSGGSTSLAFRTNSGGAGAATDHMVINSSGQVVVTAGSTVSPNMEINRVALSSGEGVLLNLECNNNSGTGNILRFTNDDPTIGSGGF